jgi:hypothetical protein
MTMRQTALWQRLVCLLRQKHQDVIRTGPGEIFLECNCCGRRTDGWNLAGSSKPGAKSLSLDQTALLAGKPTM